MAKIHAPNKQYNGVSASVTFVNGVGETDKPELLEWFESHGYEVESVKSENVALKTIEEMTVPELIIYAKSNEIDLGEAKKKDDILAVILGANPNTGADPDDAES